MNEMVEKNATLLVYLRSKSINEYGGIFCILHKKNKGISVAKNSKKAKRACSFIREFWVNI